MLYTERIGDKAKNNGRVLPRPKGETEMVIWGDVCVS